MVKKVKKATKKNAKKNEVTLNFLRCSFKCGVSFWRLGTSSRLLFAGYVF
jgi:hypothetical protein